MEGAKFEVHFVIDNEDRLNGFVRNAMIDEYVRLRNIAVGILNDGVTEMLNTAFDHDPKYIGYDGTTDEYIDYMRKGYRPTLDAVSKQNSEWMDLTTDEEASIIGVLRSDPEITISVYLRAL